MSYVMQRAARQFTVQTKEQMLSLNALPGDLCQVEGLKKNFILNKSPASTFLNWGGVSSYGTDFVVDAKIEDWVQDGPGNYMLLVEHNLGTPYMQATVYDKVSGDLVTYTTSIVDVNNLVLYCPISPDGRREVLIAIDAIIL